MEIWDRHKEKREYRGDVFPLNTDHSIKRVGLERCGLHRSYCAFFTLDGTVTYEGSGRGLEGKAKGTIDKSGIHGIFNLLEKTDLNSLADIYHFEGIEIFPDFESLYDSLLQIETKESTKIILFSHFAEPPIFRVINDLLDLLIDTAKWNKHDFFLHRDLSVKPPVKRKWG